MPMPGCRLVHFSTTKKAYRSCDIHEEDKNILDYVEEDVLTDLRYCEIACIGPNLSSLRYHYIKFISEQHT